MGTLHVPVGITPVLLRRNQFVHVRPPHPIRLSSRSGTLWITVDGEAGDTVLSAGESFDFHGRAPAVVGAMGGDASFEIRRLPQETRRSRLDALARRLARSLAHGLRQANRRADAPIARGMV